MAVRIFIQRIEHKCIKNLTSLFYGKWIKDFWRGRSDKATRCGHGFHNNQIHGSTLTTESDLSPYDLLVW